MSTLLSDEWIARCQSFQRLVVGYSGGLDSAVLLHALISCSALASRVVAIHIHHGISPHADLWQAHCQDVCAQANILFCTQSVHFDRTSNIEEGARDARYAAFHAFLKEGDCLLLGHHLDDQAETVLLQLFRGAGVDGLSGMSAFRAFGAHFLARPLLSVSRQQLQHYALAHHLSWVDDDSNVCTDYSRNYVRQQIMPLIRARWPGAPANLAQTALHCQQAQKNLHDLACHDYPYLRHQGERTLMSTNLACLDVTILKNISPSRMINVVRAWIKENNLQVPSAAIVQRILDEVVMSREDAQPVVCWPKGQVRRYRGYLYVNALDADHEYESMTWTNFPSPLCLDNKGLLLCAESAQDGVIIPDGAQIQVRYRQGGERFLWHGQHKQLKKLLQEWHIPPWKRDKIPLLYIDDQLAAVVGHAISDRFCSTQFLTAFTSYYRVYMLAHPI